MPTYEYECNKCGERFDVFQTFSEEPLKKHPGTCRGKVVKVMSPAGIVFSGSGFYKTDNRSSAKKKNGSSGDSGSKSETKSSESKPSESKSSDSTSSSTTKDSSAKPAAAASSSGS